jgi:hypothetical protein
MEIVPEIDFHFFMKNSMEFSAETGFSVEKNVREIDPWHKIKDHIGPNLAFLYGGHDLVSRATNKSYYRYRVLNTGPEGSFLNGFLRLQEKIGAYASAGFGSVFA